ncbi:MAG: hypothetical protein WKF30_10630 [Pyrinomonadaceae bacterium]
MDSFNIAVLINLLGWTLGLALYAMLLAMSVRSFGAVAQSSHGALLLSRVRRAAGVGEVISGFSLLPLATALMGLLWNAGALTTHGLQGLGLEPVGTLPFLLLGAASYAALGFLPAVVVHSAAGNLSGDADEQLARLLTVGAYALSGIAAAMHFAQVLSPLLFLRPRRCL